jgi:glycosyltransferase involved in cell wall biosynthesis
LEAQLKNMTIQEISPVFSIVLPTFNRSQVLRRSVESVLNQTFKNFELIIVDDGSNDGTREFVNGLNDSRIQYVYQENKGPSAARNTGAGLARGKYLAFLDSDDEAMPEWLQTLDQAFAQPLSGTVCCGVVIADEGNGVETGNRTVKLPHKLGPIYKDFSGIFAPPGTFALRTDIFKELGGYTPELRYSENTDLALRLTSELKTRNLQISCIFKPLVIYHRQPLRWARSEKSFSNRLFGAKYFLEHHGARYLKESPRAYANYCAIAGVNAARLGYTQEARSHFLNAVRKNPQQFRHYVRFILTFIPNLAEAYWLRFNRESD